MAVENNLCTIAWNVFCIASFDVIYKVEETFVSPIIIFITKSFNQVKISMKKKRKEKS